MPVKQKRDSSSISLICAILNFPIFHSSFLSVIPHHIAKSNHFATPQHSPFFHPLNQYSSILSPKTVNFPEKYPIFNFSIPTITAPQSIQFPIIPLKITYFPYDLNPHKFLSPKCLIPA